MGIALIMSKRQHQEGFAHVILVIVLVAALALGSVGVASAANSAKPGDALYPLDTGVESLRLGLTSDLESQIELRTEFMAERLNEAQEILQEQGADSPGLDIALANLTDHRTQIAALVAQNQELQARVEAFEKELEQSKRGLDSVFESAENDLEDLLEQAEEDKDSGEVARINSQLDNLENQRDDFVDEDENEEEIEEQEAPEPTEEPELEGEDELEEEDKNESEDEEDSELPETEELEEPES